MPESDVPDFDAADLAAAILQLDEPAPAPMTPVDDRAPAARSGALGWVLLASLVVAVAIAISLAVQWTPDSASPPEPPTCGGLFSRFCDDGDREDNDSDRHRDLFDAEEHFSSDADC